MKPIISVSHLTKDYGEHRGVFDLSFEIRQGEVFGFLGPNGAGKTTVIRHLLGFSKPQTGSCSILGLDCWTQPKEIQRHIGYVPGEIAFPEHLTGYEFLKQIAALRQMQSLDRARELIAMFEIDARGNLKRMSKGMKQKIALVTAFMHDPEIIILDEPTSGLDPLMQSRFIALINSEKARGKSFFMSSHMFEEIEKTCDRIAIIKQGQIVDTVVMDEIEHAKRKTFEIKFASVDDATRLAAESFDVQLVDRASATVRIKVADSQLNELLQALASLNVLALTEIKYSLEQHFMQYYGSEDHANV